MVCNHRLAEGEEEVQGERKYLVLRGPRGIFYRYFFCSPSLALSTPALSFFSWSRPAERTTINERIKALSSYYSLRLCSSIFSKANDEREDKLVGKSFRCSRIHRPESPKSGPRGMDIGSRCATKMGLRGQAGKRDKRRKGEGYVEWKLASGCKNSRVTSQVTVST